MKTAISVPETTFTQVERRAKALGMTRSQFYTQAAQRYLDELDKQTLTGQIDSAIDLVGVDESADAAVAAGRRLLEQAEEDW